MDLLFLIDRLEALVAEGRSLPWGKVILDRQRLFNLVDQMRVAVPGDLREAQQIVQEKDGILDAAKTEAQRILAAAEAEYRQRIEHSDFVKLGQARAKEIVDEAHNKAQELIAAAESQAATRKKEADQYTLEVLRKLDAQLVTLLANVKRGIELLEEGKGPAPR